MARKEYFVFLRVFEKYKRYKASFYSVNPYVINKGGKALSCDR